MRQRQKPEEVFLETMNTLITNLLVENPNYENGYYVNDYWSLKSDTVKTAKYILEKMNSMKHLIIEE